MRIYAKQESEVLFKVKHNKTGAEILTLTGCEYRYVAAESE